MRIYQLSIAKDGKFFFRTDKIQAFLEEIKPIIETLTKKFPAGEGYLISLTSQDAIYQSEDVPN